MTMKNILRKIGFLALFMAFACNLDKDLENPNEVNINSADADFLLNGIQLDFADFFNNATNATSPLMRTFAMNGGYTYQTAITPQNTNIQEMWRLGYQNVLINAKTVIPLAEEKGFTTHVAVAKILSAYTYMIFVDVFGDVPQTAALLGPEEFNPGVNSGSDVYAYAITLLNEARTELAKTGTAAGGALARDIYYGGTTQRAKWAALANTLELKAWLNISTLPSRAEEAKPKIAALLTLDLIDTEAENFTYKYGAVSVPDKSRHPQYDQYYGPTSGSAGGYLGNSFLYELYNGKGSSQGTVQDPRWRYYFYRQVGSEAAANKIDPKAIGCSDGSIPESYKGKYNKFFCTFDPGFYGRDHGDASGTPPDSPVITTMGVYPAAGKIDSNPTNNPTFATATVRGDGGNGAGIEPIWMSFYTDFIKAELLARGGDAAGAKAQLATAIGNSITQVRNFATAKGQTLPAGLEPSTATYQTAVGNLFDAAALKTDIIGKEFWVAAYGNGVEQYNSYRRTSAPRNLPPPIQVNAGPFQRSVVYPALYVNLNNTATQKDVNLSNKVFWDGNTETLN